jgi:hypothetical protein
VTAGTAQRVISNTARRRKWARDHPGDVIRRRGADGQRFGEWWQCVRDGEQLAEANDLGLLLTELERAFR